MRRIPLTQGQQAIVDDEDFEWLSEFKWYCTKNWNLNLHGNTVFYSSDAKQIIGGSIPYPNTAVCFDSNILHSATPISKFCNEKRLLLVYQLEKI